MSRCFSARTSFERGFPSVSSELLDEDTTIGRSVNFPIRSLHIPAQLRFAFVVKFFPLHIDETCTIIACIFPGFTAYYIYILLLICRQSQHPLV